MSEISLLPITNLILVLAALLSILVLSIEIKYRPLRVGS